MIVQKQFKQLALQFLPSRLLHRLKKMHYARTLREAVDADEPDLAMVRYLVPHGGTVVDVGANFGLYTRFLAEMVGASGRVVSIEPVPATFDLLLSNLRSLGLDNVDPLNVAISSANGSAAMRVPRYKTGGENFYEARIVATQENSPTIPVATRTLDSLFSRIQPAVSFIKCDVEGHELRCLRGAGELIQRVRPAWLLEISGNPDDPAHSAYELFHIMDSRGYTPYWFDGQALRRRHSGDRSVNYFFLTSEHQVGLRHRVHIIE